MEVFGYPLDLVTIFQVGTTAIIVAIYATLTSLGERRADHQSDCQMVLLVSFVTQEHPTLKALHQVVDLPEGDVDAVHDNLAHFSQRFEAYKKDGSLPSVETAANTNMRENLVFTFLAPFISTFALLVLRDEHKRRIFRIRTTEMRKNLFSKMVLIAIGGIGYFFLGAAVLHSVRWLGTACMIAVPFAVIGALLGVLILSFEQQAWKTYWSDRLLEILAAQDREAAHDEFNRALLLSNFINEQPDVPFPGRLGLYTGVYSVVQALILLINSQLSGTATH